MAREPKVIDHGDWEERIFDDGGVLRVGMSADQQHAFYGAYQPERVILHQSSLEEVLRLKRKRLSKDE
jgi:hypothetical protein